MTVSLPPVLHTSSHVYYKTTELPINFNTFSPLGPPAANTSDSDEEEVEAQIRWSTLTPIAVFILIYVLVISIFAIYCEQLYPQLLSFTTWVRSLGFLGGVMMTGLVFFSSFPPMPGYGLTPVLCGVVYGWALGCVPFYLGALLGADCVFLLFASIFKNYAKRIILENPKVAAVVYAVERKGFKLLVLIRLAPYPYSLMNAILAGSPGITFWQFHWATAISIVKMFINVGLGAYVQDLAHFLKKPSKQGWLIFAGFSLLALLVFCYIAWIGVKEMRKLEKFGTRLREEEELHRPPSSTAPKLMYSSVF